MTVLRDRVRAVMEKHWQPEGYTVPNADVYPFAWLWDSCFHSLIWLALDEPERALDELRHALRLQDPDTGFVPHIDYARDPARFELFWGRAGASTITQPPMYGHAVASLRRAGVDVDEDTVRRAEHGVRFFLDHRQHATGLIRAAHPWETGCDDSPRFDHWGAADRALWYEVKGALVGRLPDNGFDCAPVSLTALVAWNARELGIEADGLVSALDGRWDDDAETWADGGEAETTSGRTRTLEALLPALVCDRPSALDATTDPQAFGGRSGPASVDRREPAFEPSRYWRGGVWPQLAYLVWRAGALVVAAPTVSGALASGLAEYWDPDDGRGMGAVPQSWTGLALLMEG